jgi:hypothetical protein
VHGAGNFADGNRAFRFKRNHDKIAFLNRVVKLIKLGSKVELGLVLLVRVDPLNDLEHGITIFGGPEIADAEAKDKLTRFKRVRLLLSVFAKTNQPETPHAPTS